MNPKDTTIRKIIDESSNYGPLPERLCLDFGGVSVGVKSNNASLVRDLESYFSEFRSMGADAPDFEISAVESPDLNLGLTYRIKEPDPGKTKIKEEYVDLPDGRIVRKRLTGMVFLFGGGINYVFGACRKNSNQVVNFINNRLIQWELDRGALLAHAAAVSVNETGLGLAGFSGMGKSTLALHLMSQGADFVSNDRLMIRSESGNVTMHGVPKLPRINPGTALNNSALRTVIPTDELRRFEHMGVDEIWDIEHKYDVRIDECFGPGRFKLASPLLAFVILNWYRDDNPIRFARVVLERRRDLLGALIKSPGLFYQPTIDTPDYSQEAYLDRLKDIPVFEISGGIDFDFAASACMDLLKAV